MRSSKLRILSGIPGTTVLNFLNVFLGICGGIMLARSLSPTGRGEFTTAVLWPSVFVQVADLGLGFSLSYHVSKYRQRVDELWMLAFCIGTVTGIAAAFAGWLAIGASHAKELTSTARAGMQIILPSVPLRVITGYLANMLLGAGLITDHNLVRVCPPILNVISIFVLCFMGRGSVLSYSWAYCATMSLGFVWAVFAIVRSLRPRFCLSGSLVRPLLAYGVKTHVSSLAYEANNNLDQAAMSLIYPAAQLGLYSVAVSIGSVLNPFLNALAIVILPRTSNSANRSDTVHLIGRHFKIAALFSIPILGIAMLGVPLIVPIILGKVYAPAIIPAQVLLIAGFFQGINAFFANSLRGLGQPSKPAIAQAATLVVTAVLLYFLLPTWGILGAAITSLIAYTLASIFQVIFIMKATNAGLRQFLTAPIVLPTWTKTRLAVEGSGISTTNAS